MKRIFHKFVNVLYKYSNKTLLYKIYKSMKNKILKQVNILREKRNIKKNSLRVKVEGFWTKDEKDISMTPLFDLIKKRVIVVDKKPQLQLVSVFTKRDNIKKQKCKTIFYSGEDCTHNYPSFSDYLTDIADLSIGYYYEDEFPISIRNKVMRYPLWLFAFYSSYCGADKDRISNMIKEFDNNRLGIEKKKFCACIAGHDRWSGGVRKLLVDSISTLGHINCPGKLFHNDDSLHCDYNENKREYLKQFRFNICAENYSARGYVTEKLFDSLYSGCIPIYWGGGMQGPEPEILNLNSIILYDGSNIEEVVEKVSYLEKNKKAYMEFLNIPVFKETAVDWIYEKNCILRDRMNLIIK